MPTANDILLTVRTVTDSKGIVRLREEIKQLENTVTKVTTKLGPRGGVLSKTTTELTTLTQGLQQTRRNMLFLGLGTLFFGMQMRRTFGGLMQTGMETFRSITEATAGTQTALTGLNAAGAMLSFTIGDALNSVLEPLMPTILGLVDTIVDFIEQHPEVAFILIGGALAGIALQTFGVVTSFLSSLMGMGGKAGTGVLDNLGAIEGKLTNLAKVAGAGIGFSFLYKGFEEIKEKEFLGGLSDAFAGAGLLGVAVGKMKLKTGIAFLAISTVLKIIDAAVKEGFNLETIKNVLADALGQGALYAAMTGNIPLAAALFITDVFITSEFWKALESAWSLITGGSGGMFRQFTGGPTTAPTIPTPKTPEQWSNVQDFIVTKSGQVIKTDPNDTIMGSKSGGGFGGGNVNVTINIPNYLSNDRSMLERFAKDIGNVIVGKMSNITSPATRFG